MSREKLKPDVKWINGCLHVEANGCMVNIRPGLTDHDGRSVTAVEVLADGDRCPAQDPWFIVGANGKASITSMNIRVRQGADHDVKARVRRRRNVSFRSNGLTPTIARRET